MNSNIFEEAICRKKEGDLYECLLSPWFGKWSVVVCELVLQIVSVEQECSNSVWRDLLLTLSQRFSSVQLLVSV